MAAAKKILPCICDPNGRLKKMCPKCRIEKLLVEFHRNRGGVFGRESWCVACRRQQKIENKGIVSKPRISRIGSSPKTKICSCCEQEKLLEDFAPNSWGALGRASRCRSCYNVIKGHIRAKDPEHKKSLDTRYRERNREKIRESCKKWYTKDQVRKRNRIKQKERAQRAGIDEKARLIAHVFVNMAIKKGDLIKPGSCSRCGKGGRIEGHHVDYSEPLAVMWLCKPCHWHADREGVLK